jgi:hypothetical protein
MRTTCAFESASAPGIGSSGGIRSLQFALVLIQKICAVTLPPFAFANKEPEIVALRLSNLVELSRIDRLRFSC